MSKSKLSQFIVAHSSLDVNQSFLIKKDKLLITTNIPSNRISCHALSISTDL